MGMLLERKDVNPNPADSGGQTPFPWAIENASTRVAQLVEGPYHLTDGSAPSGLCEPFTVDLPEIPEPPTKRVRRQGCSLRVCPPSFPQLAYSLSSICDPPSCFPVPRSWGYSLLSLPSPLSRGQLAIAV